MAKFRSNNTWEQQRFYWEAHQIMREGLGVGARGIGVILLLVLVGYLASHGWTFLLEYAIMFASIVAIFAVGLALSGLILLVLGIKDRIVQDKKNLRNLRLLMLRTAAESSMRNGAAGAYSSKK